MHISIISIIFAVTKNKEMENTKLNTKVERYIQLSIKFQKSSGDIFKEELVIDQYPYSISIINESSITSSSQDYLSRAEKIRQKAETDIKLAEDYEEYIQLQRDLKQYYNALNKIEQ